MNPLRGGGGGLRLHLAPADISLGWLFRQTEDNLALADCFQSAGCTCPLAGKCKMTGILQEALKAFLAVLDRHNLAELVAEPGLLRGIIPFGDRPIVTAAE